MTRDTRAGWITIYRQMEVKIFVRSENIYTDLLWQPCVALLSCVGPDLVGVLRLKDTSLMSAAVCEV